MFEPLCISAFPSAQPRVKTTQPQAYSPPLRRRVESGKGLGFQESATLTASRVQHGEARKIVE